MKWKKKLINSSFEPGHANLKKKALTTPLLRLIFFQINNFIMFDSKNMQFNYLIAQSLEIYV